MKWATRAGIHIDRAASAWLAYGRHDDDCTFETILRRHDLADLLLGTDTPP